MIKYNKIHNAIREHYLTFIFLIILCPIFITLDFSHGLKFDAYLNIYKYPSIPISAVVILILFIWNLKALFYNKRIQILFFSILVYVALNLWFGITRALIVGSGMMLIVGTYYTFLRILKNKNAYDSFYIALSLIIIFKLLCDLLINNALIIPYDPDIFHTYPNQYLNSQFRTVDTKIFVSVFFINRSFVIYNFYDYFPFIYFLSTILSINNLLQRRYSSLSIILLVISNLVMVETVSRLFIYSIYLIPFLYIFYQVTKLSLERYFYLFLFICLAIIFIVGFSDFDVSDPSLKSRYNHIHLYFLNFSLVNMIFPYLNEHRIIVSGSLHNELLEIFSFFGVVTVYYLFILKQIFCNTKSEFKFISYLLIFILIIGSLIQINISNPYVGILAGVIFAVLSGGSKKISP